MSKREGATRRDLLKGGVVGLIGAIVARVASGRSSDPVEVVPDIIQPDEVLESRQYGWIGPRTLPGDRGEIKPGSVTYVDPMPVDECCRGCALPLGFAEEVTWRREVSHPMYSVHGGIVSLPLERYGMCGPCSRGWDPRCASCDSSMSFRNPAVYVEPGKPMRMWCGACHRAALHDHGKPQRCDHCGVDLTFVPELYVDYQLGEPSVSKCLCGECHRERKP